MNNITQLNNIITSIDNVVNVYVWYIAFVFIISFGLYLTIKLEVIQLKHLSETLRITFRNLYGKNIYNSLTSFQVFCVSVGYRTGTGNIAGMAVAIVSGGPGAIFWLWIFAILAVAISFAECTLGQIYKERKINGSIVGGSAYYIKNALRRSKLASVMAFLTMVYSFVVCGIVSNTSTLAFTDAFSTDQIVFTIILTILAAVIIFGGMNRIADVSVWMMPIIIVLWITICLIIILLNITMIPHIFQLIFEYAFGIQAFAGGGVGVAIMCGLKRCIFSTDAGVGTIPSISSSADIKHPVNQGLIQSFGVIIDTSISSVTAFVVLIYTSITYPTFTDIPVSGIVLVQDAVSKLFLGDIAPTIVAFFMLVFCFSTLISSYILGEANAKYINQRKEVTFIFQVSMITMIFIASMMSLDLIWNLTDTFYAIMCICNLSALIFLSKYAIEAMKDYFAQKANGIEEPVFNVSCLSDTTGVTCWSNSDKIK